MRPRKKTNLQPRLAACASIIIQNPLEKKGLLRQEFPNPEAPLHLEIGCGKGQFARALAALHPDINFIAMEREPNVAVIATEHALADGLTNLRFLLEDAEKLPLMFQPEELDQIYINFCDPWHKHRQFKRRLTYRGKLEVYLKLLKPGGELHFKTDNYMLYHFSTFEFGAVFPAYFTTKDLHHSQYAQENIMTEYETYFSNLGQPIYSIRARKPLSAQTPEPSPEKQ